MSTRILLEQRLQELLAREERLQVHLRNADGRLDTNTAEWSTLLQNDEVVSGLDALTAAQVRSVLAALARVEDGTYGICTGCGDAIAPGRLEALPETTVCVRCAA